MFQKCQTNWTERLEDYLKHVTGLGILINLWWYFMRISFSVLALIFTVSVTYFARDSHYTIIQLADSQTRRLANRRLAVYFPLWKRHFLSGFQSWRIIISSMGQENPFFDCLRRFCLALIVSSKDEIALSSICQLSFRPNPLTFHLARNAVIVHEMCFQLSLGVCCLQRHQVKR